MHAPIGDPLLMRLITKAIPSSWSLSISYSFRPRSMIYELKHARKRKLKKVVERTPPRLKDIAKEKIAQCMKPFIEFAKSLLEPRKSATLTTELHNSMKAAIEFYQHG